MIVKGSARLIVLAGVLLLATSNNSNCQTQTQQISIYKTILADINQLDDTAEKEIKFDGRIFKWNDSASGRTIRIEFSGRHDPLLIREFANEALITGTATPAIKANVALHDTSKYGPCNVAKGEVGVAISEPKYANTSFAQVLVLLVSKRRDRFDFQQYLYDLRRDRSNRWVIENRSLQIRD